MITIIDYKMGNVGSIQNMFKKVGAESIITSDIEIIKSAQKLILPGVGSFDNGMKNLVNLGLVDVLNEKVLEEKTPILGICLGMQLMTNESEEGQEKGLSWIKASTIKFKFPIEHSKLRIPHMGWNLVNIKKDSKLLSELPKDPRYYFVHSYHVVCQSEDDILTTTNYNYEFTSSFQKENIFGVQFHPEKSHKYGIRLMKNFSEMI